MNNKERDMKIRDMVYQGKTFASIAREFSLTRERIRQILKTHFGITGKDEAKEIRDVYKGIPERQKRRRAEMLEGVVKKPYRANQVQRELNNKRARERYRRLKENPEEYAKHCEKQRIKMKKRYRDDPEFRKKMKEATKRYYEMVKKNPKFMERQRERSKRYYHEHKNDPAYKGRVKKYYVDNKEKFRAYSKKYREDNHETILY